MPVSLVKKVNRVNSRESKIDKFFSYDQVGDALIKLNEASTKNTEISFRGPSAERLADFKLHLLEARDSLNELLQELDELEK